MENAKGRDPEAQGPSPIDILQARVAELEALSLRLQKKLDDIEGIAMSLPADPLCTPIMLIVRQ